MGNVALIILLTLILLELVTRIVWRNEASVMILDKELRLLPLPLVSEPQLTILENWEQTPNGYIQFDPTLGWSLRPNAQTQNEGQTYTANSIGLPGLREYPRERVAGVTRIAAFGPSFTHGDEVSDTATWPAQMEQVRPNLEVMNWGVGGYGTDQAFLRYTTQGQAYQPDIVLIGFEEDNTQRNVNRFRPFFHPATGIPLTKPMFIQADEGLRLIENPFQDFQALKRTLLDEPNRFLEIVCPHDKYCASDEYQPMALDIFTSFRFLRTLVYEARQLKRQDVSLTPANLEAGRWLLDDVQAVSWQLLQMFVEEAASNGAIPVVVAFPECSSIEAYEQDYDQATFYRTGVIFLRQQGVHVIELPPAFVEHKTDANLDYAAYYAADGGHFNQLGNQIVSQAILAYLCQKAILENCVQPN